MPKYNGWKNYATWNVWLWITGDTHQRYDAAVNFMRANPELATPYRTFVTEQGLTVNPDGVNYLDLSLDYARLNEAMKEL